MATSGNILIHRRLPFHLHRDLDAVAIREYLRVIRRAGKDKAPRRSSQTAVIQPRATATATTTSAGPATTTLHRQRIRGQNRLAALARTIVKDRLPSTVAQEARMPDKPVKEPPSGGDTTDTTVAASSARSMIDPLELMRRTKGLVTRIGAPSATSANLEPIIY
jgi:hypothetical protein